MVDLLWKDGHEAAAIRLETLWNQLGSTHDFALLCGYSMGNFYKGAALDEIKGQHFHLVDDDGRRAISPAGDIINTDHRSCGPSLNGTAASGGFTRSRRW